MPDMTRRDREQIAEILKRRANEIAYFGNDYRQKEDHFGSVEMALTREVERLRRLADRVNPQEPEDEDAANA